MDFNFVVDRLVQGQAYPTLARHSAEPYTEEWQQFVQHWPYTVPCELIEHCKAHDYPYNLYTIKDDYPANSYYPIGIGFFDFDIDYFGLLPDAVFDHVQQGRLQILFYYHEGDNPMRIRDRLDLLLAKWHLPEQSYVFVSGNTAVDRMAKFVYLPDHELLYWRRNLTAPATPINSEPRTRDFTVLSRTHKWWRASVIADLHRNGLLDRSYWSYRTDVNIGESAKDNPIEVDELNLRYYLDQFLKGTPYTCDQLTADEHNNHALVETAHYSDSYCNIVLETYLDADGSGGAFLTEKTFKPIKHGQPFIIVGPPGCLHRLRTLGYRTFDHAIDNTYDFEPDPTERWRKIFKAIVDVKQQNQQEWFEACRPDVVHNQQLFQARKYERLNMFYTKLREQRD